MRACLFPVILAPVEPPKSVTADSIPKPLIELSILMYESPEQTGSMRQFKYVCALVQELHLKIDQGPNSIETILRSSYGLKNHFRFYFGFLTCLLATHHWEF